jgi:hypothetical protein
MSRKVFIAFLLGICVCSLPVRAVLFYSTSDPNYNTWDPTGTTNTAWQLEGRFMGFLGTPIAPHYFITAQHIGGATGEVFAFGTNTYTTTAVFNDVNSDLAIWRIDGTFSTWASLYTGSDELGKSLFVAGRGTQRGDPFVVNGATNGWYWGVRDGTWRWGENAVSGITNFNDGAGEQLSAAFDPNAGPNECTLSRGDSGGAVFVWDGAEWALAGINHSVTGGFSTNSTGPYTNAAVFNMNGLYVGSSSAHEYISTDTPSSFYATRISAEAGWIGSVIPEPSSFALVGLSLFALALRCRSVRRNR